jgi:hypothetical protein
MRLNKLLLSLILILAFAEAKAQIITGKVVGDTSDRPVAATLITHSGYQTSNDANGNFKIHISGIGDTIKVLAVGYQDYVFPVKDIKQDHLVIRLKTFPVMMKEVTITAERNHKKDSIELRKEYGKVFNYQPPKIKDAFVGPPPNVPFAFVSIDLIGLFNALNKKNDPEYKLKKVLLRDEEANYVATRFNKSLVTRVTGLKGDSLNVFMDKYYPTTDWVKKASDYDIMVYVKTKVAEFRKKP